MPNKIVTQPLSNQIADRLRDEIVFGDLQPGDRILEEQLAKEFNVSRIPIREALKTLDSEGYIEIIPYKGNIVRKPNEMELREAQAIHLALSPVVLKMAFPNYTDEIFRELDQLCAEMDNSKDYKEFNKLNYKLMDALYAPSQMFYALRVLKDSLRANVRGLEIFFNSYNTDETITQNLKEMITLVKQKKYEEAINHRMTYLLNLSNAITEDLINENKNTEK